MSKLQKMAPLDSCTEFQCVEKKATTAQLRLDQWISKGKS